MGNQFKVQIRPAIGQIASIGDIYDARSDNFTGLSVFKTGIPQSALTTTNNHTSDIKFLYSDTYTEKFHNLDISAELSVSVLAGLFSLSGSGKYLKDQKSSSKSVRCSILYNILTDEEKLNIYSDAVKEYFVQSEIENCSGTHVVVGISWGANAMVSCEHKNTENREAQEIHGMLSATFQALAFSISGEAKVDFREHDIGNSANFEIKVFGDVLPDQSAEIPTNLHDAIDFIKKTPKFIKSSNNGKGKPLKYTLIPIEALRKHLNISIKTDKIVQQLADSSLQQIVGVFEDISDSKQQLNDFYMNVKTHKYCLKLDEYDFAKNLKLEFEIEEAKFRENLAQILVEVRSGKLEPSSIDNLRHEYLKNKSSPANILAQIESGGYISEKIALADTLTKLGVTYIGSGKSLDSEILQTSAKAGSTVFVLFFTAAEKLQNPEKWLSNRNLFINNIQNYQSNGLFFVVDGDAQPSLMSNHGLCISVYRNGIMEEQDLYEVEEKMKNVPVARTTTSMQNRGATKPNKRVNLEIICPGSNCPQAELEWICDKCHEPVEFGFDTTFYCDCGQADAATFEFRCGNPKHGPGYRKFEKQELQDQLKKLRPMKEINILILGETGVGKSTWINGFFNYINYESLDEAEKHPLSALIQSKFTVTDENYEEVVVHTGNDKNEVQVNGQSATQLSQVYQFRLGDKQLRLIDTPGIGDTRGVDQDKKNFSNILDTISNLEEIHGICILLKPNNSRITTAFRFCVKELLVHLHKDACQNIVFCFTNSRSTFYKPGDTLPAFRTLLNETSDLAQRLPLGKHTIYCFDNEAFRFLAAIKNGIQFDSNEKQNFEASWTKSYAETMRMFEHISRLPPHEIRHTTSMNQTRQLIITMTKPLANVTRNIHRNMERIQSQQEEIKNSNLKGENLKKLLFIKKIDLKATPLSRPRTVCSHKDCIKVLITPDNMQRTIYKSLCHNPCSLTGVSVDTLGDVGLLRCAAIYGSDYCRHCKHHYTVHLHTLYETEEVLVDVEDINIKHQMNSNKSEVEQKQEALENLEYLQKEYEREGEIFAKATAQFGVFLKHNAITPFNDGLIEYLKMLIKVEECKDAKMSNENVLINLRADLEKYQEQFRILEAELEKCDGASTGSLLTPNGVNKLVKELCNLKHFGKDIEAELNAAEIGRSTSTQYSEITAPRIQRNDPTPGNHSSKTGKPISSKSKSKRLFNWW